MNLRTIGTAIASASALSLAPAEDQTALRGAAQTPPSRVPNADHRDLSQVSTNHTLGPAPNPLAGVTWPKPNTTTVEDLVGTCVGKGTKLLSVTDAVSGELVYSADPITCPQNLYPDEIFTNETIPTDRVESGQGILLLQDISCCTQPPASRTRPEGNSKGFDVGPITTLALVIDVIAVGICVYNRRASIAKESHAATIEMRQGPERRASDASSSDSTVTASESDINTIV